MAGPEPLLRDLVDEYRVSFGGCLKFNQRAVMNGAFKMKGRTDRQRSFHLASKY
jgi:hypothetical protein